jgi:anti-sigma regulatory factor (Ser/Thr protein kinase)
VSALLDPHTGDHVVQFYEDDAELLEGAGAFLGDEDAANIVIATEAHRALGEGPHVVWLDAAETLAGFTRDGRVDRASFFDSVGRIVHTAAATGRPVRAFGEMVALLWEAGDVAGAIELETLWNELQTQVSFSLYCAYRSASVAGNEHALRVCHLHSAVVDRTWEFAAEHAAPSEAREALVGALRDRGRNAACLDDVRLIVTELAANAVMHARSPFWVAVREEGPTVHIRVGDRSPVAPEMRDQSSVRSSGRGLRLIAALATRWGVEFERDGKVVWVELNGA